MRNTALSVVFAALMMVSMVAAPLGAGVVAGDLGASGDTIAQTSVPDGMVGVPGDQIGSDLPRNTPMGEAAADLEEAGVHTSAHAGTLDVIVTSPGRAENKYSGGHVNGDGPLALVFADDENHDGREVAVPADELEAILGHQPEVMFGAHESGDEWVKEVRYEGDYAVFEVPKFSENTVTFSGSVSLQGDSAGDGTQYQYEVDNTSAVGGFTINTTGVNNTEWTNQTGQVSGDTTISQNLGGTSIRGPGDTGKPVLTVETPNGGENATIATTESGGLENYMDGTTSGTALELTDAPTEINSVWVKFGSVPSESATTDLYMSAGELNRTFGEGEKVASNVPLPTSAGWHKFELDTTVTGLESENRIEFEMTNYGTLPGVYTILYDSSVDSTKTGAITDESTTFSYPAFAKWNGGPQASQASVSTDTGESHDFGSLTGGTPETAELDLSPSTTELSFTTDGPLNYTLEVQEVTATQDPVVELNGHTTSYTGTLAEGETVSLATNESWVEEGTNTVNISTNSPSTGPESLTGLDYSHEVGGPGVSTVVDATTWGEKINSTRVYPSDTNNPEVTVPFADRVVSVESAEYRVNGSSWQAVPSSTYTGTTLTAQLPDVAAGSEVEVRANGSKVRAVTGTFTVTEPTTPGNPLTSTIRADEVGDSGQLAIGVEGTEHGNKAHYVADSGWSDDSRMVYTASGNANLVMPNAEPGREADLRTAPINASPESGPVEITDVAGEQDKPEFTVVSDSENPVDYTFTDAEDGQYELYDATADQQLDTGEANSPVTLTAEGDYTGHTLVIRPWSPDTQTGPGPLGQAGDGGISIPFGNIPTALIPALLIGGVGVGGVLLYRRRTADNTPKSGVSGGYSDGSERSSLISRVPGSAFIGGVYGSVRGLLGRLPLSSAVGRVWDATVSALRFAGGVVWRLSAFVGRWAFSAGKSGAKTAGGWLVARLRRPAIGLGGISVVGMVAIRAGIISPTDEVRLLLAAVAALIGAAVALRAVGLLTWQYYSVVAAATFLLVGEAVSPGSIAPAIGNGIEEVFPIIAIVGAYLIVRRVRSGGGLTGGGSGGSGGEGSDGDPDVTIVTQGATVDDSTSSEGGD